MSGGGHVVVLASAGSGKTHELTTRLIGLLLAGERPEAILATTFTRKAAGEILARVVARLIAACRDESAAAGLVDGLKALPGGQDGAASPRARCEAALMRLGGAMHRLGVQTMDALFGRLARGFAMELGVPAGWALADEEAAAAMREAAVERALGRAGAERLRTLLEGTSPGGLPMRPLRAAVRAAESASRAWAEGRGSMEPWRWLSVEKPAGDLAALIEAARCAPLPRSKKGEPNGHWRKGLGGLIEHAAAGEWLGVLKSAMAEVAWGARADYFKAPPEAGFEACVRPVVAWAVAEELRLLGERTRSLGELAGAIAVELAREKLSSGLVEFADVPAMLLGRWPAAGGNAVGDPTGRGVMGVLEEVYFRLDARVRHLMLDEFQDTSAEQFELIEPVLAELVAGEGAGAGGRSVFCVGDVKQSLYMWRGAVPELLRGLAGAGGRYPQMRVERRWVNRRSSPAVLEAVNLVLGGVQGLGELAESVSVRAWTAGFDRHKGLDEPGRMGHVSLWTIGAGDAGEDEPEEDSERGSGALEAQVARQVAGRVAALLTADPRATIGVLTRRTAPIAGLVHAIRGELASAGLGGVVVSAEAAAPVTDAPETACAVSLLHLIDHPGDSMAAFHVASSPIGEAVGLAGLVDAEGDDGAGHAEGEPKGWWTGDRAAAVRAVASRLARRVSREGVGGLLTELLERCGGRMDARGLARFERLIDEAEAVWAELCRRGASATAGAVAAVLDARPVEGGGVSGVRVMTVHKSKGLEFDAVLMVDLDQAWRVKPGELLMDRGEALEPVTRVVPMPAQALLAYSPELEEIVGRARERRVMEELCVLYVGMTRARESLELFIRPVAERADAAKDGQGVPSAAPVLRRLLAPALFEEAKRPGERLWHAGDSSGEAALAAALVRKRAKGGIEPAIRAAVDGLPVRLAKGEASGELRLAAASPSGLEGSAGRRASDILGGGAGTAGAWLGLGSMVHAVLERVEWIEDLRFAGATPEDAAWNDLRMAARRAEPGASDEDIDAAVEMCHGALRHAAVREVLSRSAAATRLGMPADGGLRVYAEHPFVALLAVGEREVTVSGRFDRVVVAMDSAGRAASAEVVDFKTDRVEGAERATRVEHYRPQLEAYRGALAQMLGLGVERVGATLVFLRSGDCVAW